MTVSYFEVIYMEDLCFCCCSSMIYLINGEIHIRIISKTKKSEHIRWNITTHALPYTKETVKDKNNLLYKQFW